MASARYSNLRSKCDRAIVAYLKTALGADKNIYPANHNGDRAFPNLTVHTRSGVPEVHFSGTYRFQVRVIARANGVAAEGQTSKTTNRAALDYFYAAAVDALLQCATGEQNFAQVARNITDAGRALAPTTLILKSAGETAANGTYEKNSADLWTHTSGNYTIEYDAGTNLWQLKDAAQVVLYTCTVPNFPNLAWVRASGDAPVPAHKFEEAWNDWDMADFTVNFWNEATLDGGEDESDGNAFVEIAGFQIVASPSAIIGYSNTPGE